MKKKFKLIEIIFNKILNNQFSNHYIYGLPILYIQKGHKEYIKPYSNFILRKKLNQKFINFVNKIIKYFSYFLTENKIYYKKNVKFSKFDIILLSNIISENKFDKDYIYGDLSANLNKNNIKTLTVFKNFTNLASKRIKINLKSPTVVLAKTAGIKKEISFLYGIFLAKKSLNLLLRKIQDSKTRKFLKYINKIYILLPIVSNLRLFFQIKTLVQRYEPKVILLTFENHSWERFLINRIKSYNKNIICVSYQFSTISQSQFTKNSILKKKLNPDLILSSGSTTFKYLNKIFKNKIKVVNFGSSRFENQIVRNKNYNRNFLLVPESPLSETYDFFLNALKFSKKYNNCNFTLRLHPMSKSDNIIKKIQVETKKIKNFSLSFNSLEEDFSKNFFLIYRSSSLCISGSLKGLLPVYLEDKNFNMDPLFDINKSYKIKVPSDLGKILLFGEYKNLKNSKKIQMHSKKYFEKINVNIIKKLL